MTDAIEASAKAVLRVTMRALRRQLVQEHPEGDWQAADHVQDLLNGLKLTRPGIAAVYKASGNEIDPRPLAEALIRLGWKIALPVCEDFRQPITFRAFAPGDRLAPDAMQIASPLASAPEVEPDLVITPLLAFDPQGNRLGQGGGYYDRTLERLRTWKKKVHVVGLAFSGQEVERVPSDPHDQKLDAILTEKGYRPLA